MADVAEFIRKHFSEQDLEEIRAAICTAERKSTGEIKVVVEERSQGEPLEDAKRIFLKHGLQNTRQRNAVLLALFAEDRRFAILGDEGIDRVVGPGFWDHTATLMAELLRAGKFKEGLLAGIASVGDKLVEFFPPSQQNINELPDDVCS